MINNGDMYRVVAATTVANLSNPNCNFTDPLRIRLRVISCGPILSAKLISFSGRNANDKATLQWTTTGETEPIDFAIEKSSNGTDSVSYTHLRAHETVLDIVCRLLLEQKTQKKTKKKVMLL